MAVYEMKYMYDWGSGCCVWSINDAAREKYDFPVFAEQLPISDDLKTTLDYLISKHDEALDWDCPQNDLLWDEEQINLFIKEAISAYERLCVELGDEYRVELWEDCLI